MIAGMIAIVPFVWRECGKNVSYCSWSGLTAQVHIFSATGEALQQKWAVPFRCLC